MSDLSNLASKAVESLTTTTSETLAAVTKRPARVQYAPSVAPKGYRAQYKVKGKTREVPIVGWSLVETEGSVVAMPLVEHSDGSHHFADWADEILSDAGSSFVGVVKP